MNPEAFIASHAFVGALVALLVYCFLEIMGWSQGGREKKCRCGGKKGNGRGVQPLGTGFVLLEPSQPLRNRWPMHPDMDVLCETAEKLNRTIKDLTRHLELSNCETAEGRDSSLTSTMACEVEANSVQQHQQNGDIQLPLPAPPPEMPNVHSGEREIPLQQHKCQETMEGLIHESRLEQELDLSVTVKTLQNGPASAPPRPHRQENRGVVVPIVQDLPFLDEAVKRELEALISKMNIQRRYGLQRRLLDCEPCFEYLNRK